MGSVQCASTRDPALSAGSRQTSKHLNPGALDAERKRNHKNRCTELASKVIVSICYSGQHLDFNPHFTLQMKVARRNT